MCLWAMKLWYMSVWCGEEVWRGEKEEEGQGVRRAFQEDVSTCGVMTISKVKKNWSLITWLPFTDKFWTPVNLLACYVLWWVSIHFFPYFLSRQEQCFSLTSNQQQNIDAYLQFYVEHEIKLNSQCILSNKQNNGII